MNPCYLPLFYSGRATPYPADLDSINWWALSQPATVNVDEVVDKIDPAKVSAATYGGVNVIDCDGNNPAVIFEGSSGIHPADKDFKIVQWFSAEAGNGGFMRNKYEFATGEREVSLQLGAGGEITLYYSQDGTAITILNTAGGTFNDGLQHCVEAYRVGTVIYIDVDETNYLTTDRGSVEHIFEGPQNWRLATVDLNNGDFTGQLGYGYVEIDGVKYMETPLEEGEGIKASCTTGKGISGTISGGITWTTRDGFFSANLNNGHTPNVYVSGVLETPLANEIPINGGKFYNTSTNTVRTVAGGVTKYDPALPFKSKSIATFEATASLTNASIVPADNYTVNGTAVPTVGTGEITFTAGTVEQLLLDGVVVADFTVQLGKTVDTVGGYAISVGAGGLDYFWGVRVEDADGVIVDAVNYLLIAVSGGWWTNNWEGYIRHTDAIISAYDNYYANTGAFVDRSYEDDIQAVPYEDSFVPQFRPDPIGTLGLCVGVEAVLYEDGHQFTPAGYIKTENWRTKFDDDCGASALIPYPIDSGDGIGPNNGWYPIDDEYVYLVEDA